MDATHFKITLLEYACKCVVSIFLESNGCAEFDSEMTGYLKVIAGKVVIIKATTPQKVFL